MLSKESLDMKQWARHRPQQHTVLARNKKGRRKNKKNLTADSSSANVLNGPTNV